MNGGGLASVEFKTLSCTSSDMRLLCCGCSLEIYSLTQEDEERGQLAP